LYTIRIFDYKPFFGEKHIYNIQAAVLMEAVS
jgi:hypothetical protein